MADRTMSTTVMSSDNTLERHESMGLTNVVFKFRNRRIQVPIQMFSESEPFSSIIKRVTSEHPGQPLRVGADNEDGFLQFMRYMIQSRARGQNIFDVAAYTSILKFVTKFRFELTRRIVIRDFPTIDVVEKIALARDCCVEEWLVPSLNTYVSFGKSMTLQDVERMGTKYAIRIIRIRANLKQAIHLVDRHQVDRHKTEVDIRPFHDFTGALEILFAKEIRSFKGQPSSVTPCDTEDFDLVEMHFLVEDRLFRSYRQIFEASPIFQDMFALPAQNNMLPDGCSEAQPLRLEGIKKVDFTPFIEMINPGPPVEMEFSLEQWTSILKLSTMWEFAEMRQYAINTISQLGITPAKEIQLAREYRIQEWLIPALNAYARQQDPVTHEDIELLTWPYALRVVQAREEMAKMVSPWVMTVTEFTPWIIARVGKNFKDAIESVFRDEIERMQCRA